MDQRVIILFILFLLAASIYCAHYEYHLSVDAIFMYISIAIGASFGCTLLALAIVSIAAQIRRFISYLRGSNETPSVATVEAVTPAEQALHELEELATERIENPTLPTYTTACLRCNRVRIADSSPPYPPDLTPPPSYLTYVGQTSNHNTTLTQEPPSYTSHCDCNV
uniref:Uncharacterized protein n=1 Tax=Panagrellus redivivus TaxID=6233 RepID=A0A7E4V3P8_PANRE